MKRSEINAYQADRLITKECSPQAVSPHVQMQARQIAANYRGMLSEMGRFKVSPVLKMRCMLYEIFGLESLASFLLAGAIVVGVGAGVYEWRTHEAKLVENSMPTAKLAKAPPNDTAIPFTQLAEVQTAAEMQVFGGEKMNHSAANMIAPLTAQVYISSRSNQFRHVAVFFEEAKGWSPLFSDNSARSVEVNMHDKKWSLPIKLLITPETAGSQVVIVAANQPFDFFRLGRLSSKTNFGQKGSWALQQGDFVVNIHKVGMIAGH